MKNYTAPWLDVVEFSPVDIIATSEEEGGNTETEATTTTEENKSPWA